MEKQRKWLHFLILIIAVILLGAGFAVFAPSSIRSRLPLLPATGRNMAITEVLSEINTATRLDVPDYPFSGNLDEEKSRQAWEYLKDVKVSFIGFGEGKETREKVKSDQPLWLWGMQNDCIFIFDEETAVLTVKRSGRLTARYTLIKNGEPYIPEDLYVWLWNTLLTQGHPRRPDRLDDTEPIIHASDRNSER